MGVRGPEPPKNPAERERETAQRGGSCRGVPVASRKALQEGPAALPCKEAVQDSMVPKPSLAEKQRFAHSKNLLAAWKVAVQESNSLRSIEAEKVRFALMENVTTRGLS